MVAMGGIELDWKLLNGRRISRSTPIVTVKLTVSSARFGWTQLDRREVLYPVLVKLTASKMVTNPVDT